MQLLTGTGWLYYQLHSAHHQDWVRMIASRARLFLLLVKQVFQVYMLLYFFLFPGLLPWVRKCVLLEPFCLALSLGVGKSYLWLSSQSIISFPGSLNSDLSWCHLEYSNEHLEVHYAKTIRQGTGMLSLKTRNKCDWYQEMRTSVLLCVF